MMPILLPGQTQQSAYIRRQIKCPGHYIIPPNIDIYKRVPIYDPQGLIKSAPDKVEYFGKTIKINKTQRAKDRWGRPIIDWKKIYELERQGIVKQPWVTAAWAIENVWDPQNQLCQQCRLRPCREGQGIVVQWGINRLVGKKCRDR
jgi:hypothetical protein